MDEFICIYDSKLTGLEIVKIKSSGIGEAKGKFLEYLDKEWDIENINMFKTHVRRINDIYKIK